MMPDRLRTVSVGSDTTIRAAMEVLSGAVLAGAPTGMVLVVDDDDRLLGIMTDGDIRRGLLRGTGLDDPVASVMVSDPVVLPDSLSASELLERVSVEAGSRARLRELKVDKLILVDDDGRVTDIVDFYDLWYQTQAPSRSVAVLGLGFVGLTLAATLADAGLDVVGVETDEGILSSVRSGKAHFHEVGLDPLLAYLLEKGHLRIASEIDQVEADTFIICVGTPIDPESGEPGLDDLKEAARSVAGRVRKRGLVVVRSTVPVGACRRAIAPIIAEGSGLRVGRDVFLSFAPERTVEGKALEELRHLPQIVGGYDRTSAQMTANLMRNITATIVEVESLEAAEMVKLVNNSFRDLSFAFANQLALICDHWNLDAAELVRAANDGYPRDRVPTPSPGVGGFCLTKDPLIFDSVAREAGVEDGLAGIGRGINVGMPSYVANRVLGFLKDSGRSPSDAKVLLAGLAFKGQPETSDVRFSTGVDMLRLLQKDGIEPWGCDAVVADDAIRALGARPCSLEEGFAEADVVAILNNHMSFTKLDLFSLLGAMRRPGLLFDAWHLFLPEEVCRVDGISYASMGMIRRASEPTQG